jgi:ribosome-associated protein
MEDMLTEIESGCGAVLGEDAAAVAAGALGDLLREHKGSGVTVLDLREMNGWTDFFVIATAASSAHMDGLERHIKEFCRERDMEILRRSRRPEKEEDEWRLIDLGPVVVHLMSARARSFYELERLYSLAAPLGSTD